MKKIITILLAVAIILTFVACAPVTDGNITNENVTDGNITDGNITDGNITNENVTDGNDPFANIEETLTIPVTSLEDFDFTGTWDFINISSYKGSFESGGKTEKGYITIIDGKMTSTFTYFDTFFNFVSEEAYEEQKTYLQEFPENSFELLKIDDNNMTITVVASPEYLKSMNYESTLEEFINILYDNDSFDGITTNEAKTVLKFSFNTNEENDTSSGSMIWVKR